MTVEKTRQDLRKLKSFDMNKILNKNFEIISRLNFIIKINIFLQNFTVNFRLLFCCDSPYEEKLWADKTCTTKFTNAEYSSGVRIYLQLSHEGKNEEKYEEKNEEYFEEFYKV